MPRQRLAVLTRTELLTRKEVEKMNPRNSNKVFIPITAKRYAFQPSEIRVRHGERVRLIFTTLDVTHGFLLQDFAIRKTIRPVSGFFDAL